MDKKKKEARGEKRERWLDEETKDLIWSIVKGVVIGVALGKLLGVITEVLWGF